MKNYIPDKGDIVWIDFSPQIGYEQSGRRPAITLTSNHYNAKSNLALFCPITSKIKNYPFEIPIKQYLKVESVALTDQIKSFDWKERNAVFISKIDDTILLKILDNVKILLDS